MDKWRVWATLRAQGNRRHGLFEVVRNAVAVAQESSLNLAFKEIRLLRDRVLEKEDISSREERGKESQQNMSDTTVVSLLSVLLNSCCTLRGATHAMQTNRCFMCVSQRIKKQALDVQ